MWLDSLPRTPWNPLWLRSNVAYSKFEYVLSKESGKWIYFVWTTWLDPARLQCSQTSNTAVRWLIWLSSKLSIQDHLLCFIHFFNSWQDESFTGSTISSHSTKALVKVTSIGERPCYEQSDAICRALVIDSTHTVCIGHNNAVTRVKIAHFVHTCFVVQYTVTNVLSQSFKVL